MGGRNGSGRGTFSPLSSTLWLLSCLTGGSPAKDAVDNHRLLLPGSDRDGSVCDLFSPVKQDVVDCDVGSDGYYRIREPSRLLSRGRLWLLIWVKESVVPLVTPFIVAFPPGCAMVDRAPVDSVVSKANVAEMEILDKAPSVFDRRSSELLAGVQGMNMSFAEDAYLLPRLVEECSIKLIYVIHDSFLILDISTVLNCGLDVIPGSGQVQIVGI